MELELFPRYVVVLYVFTAACLCYASSFPGSMEEVEVLKHLNRLNKPPVKSIKVYYPSLYNFTIKSTFSSGHGRLDLFGMPKAHNKVEAFFSPDGDIIDCVHISHQPAFDHPLLKNHTIKMRPSDHPNWIKDNNIKNNASKVITQLWHSNGKCPTGTVPIIRTKKEDILRAGSLKNYGKKKYFPVAQPNSIDPEPPAVGNDHEYAHAQTGQGVYYGAQATFSLWNPKVQEKNEFSLSQLWVTGGSYPDLDSIEAGWHVDPEIYDGDTNTRLFIYWTNDGYQTTGCYNLKCPGFVQTNNEIAIGGSISPTSQVDGSQYEITILIWKDTKQGVWWMHLNGKEVGYWPASLYSSLSESASALDFGGEVINKGVGGQHTTTQMGSGNFPQDGAGKASYIKDIQSVDESNTLTPLRDLTPMTSPSASCYDIVKNDNDNQFFFGGPGRNQNCP